MNADPTPRFDGDEELHRILEDLDAPPPYVGRDTAEGFLPGSMSLYPCAVCLAPEWQLDAVQIAPDDATNELRHPFAHEFVPLTPRGELEGMLATGTERALWRFGRALASMADEQRALGRYRRMVTEEIDAQAARLSKRMAALEELIADELLRQREADPNRKSLTLPGVGTWTSRKQGASWRTVDEQAVLATLVETPDEFALFTEEKTTRVVRKDDLKGWLNEHGFEAFPGMELTPEHIAVKSPFA